MSLFLRRVCTDDEYRLRPPAGLESLFPIIQAQNMHDSWLLAVVFAVSSSITFWLRNRCLEVTTNTVGLCRCKFVDVSLVSGPLPSIVNKINIKLVWSSFQVSSFPKLTFCKRTTKHIHIAMIKIPIPS